MTAPSSGQNPADFPMIPLRYLATFVTGRTPDKARVEYWRDGTIPWVSPKDMKSDIISDSIDHVTELARADDVIQLAPADSVLIVVRGMILAHSLPVAVTAAEVAINQDVKALICQPPIRPQFLKAVLDGQSQRLLCLADSAAHGPKVLSTEVLQRLEVPCPPLDVQDRIVAQLRRKSEELRMLADARADALRFIDEKRTAVVVSAVTRGARPARAMRRSGLPWLAELPAHWEVRRVGHLGEVATGMTPARDRPEYWTGGTLPWLTSAAVQEGEVSSAREFVTDAALSQCHLPILRPGAVLVATRGQGRSRGLAAVLSTTATINQNVVAIQPDQKLVDPWYLRWVLFAAYVFLRGISDDGAGERGALTREEVARLRIPLPTVEEQRAIVSHITHETEILDSLAEAASDPIELAHERYTALLAAVAASALAKMESHAR